MSTRFAVDLDQTVVDELTACGRVLAQPAR